MAEKPPELLFLLDLPSSVTLTPRQLRAERLHNDRISYVWCYVPRHKRKSGPTGVVEHGRDSPSRHSLCGESLRRGAWVTGGHWTHRWHAAASGLKMIRYT